MAKHRLQKQLTLAVTVCVVSCVSYSYAVPCSPNSWIQVPATDGASTVLAPQFTSLSDCQSNCTNTPFCYGISWNGTTCFYNHAPSNSSNSGINYMTPSTVTYYALIRNYPNCNYNDYNCTYNWTGQPATHGFSGAQNNKNNLIDCIRACQDDSSCLAIDWNNEDASCWTYSSLPYIANITNITHFTKVCTNGLPVTAIPTTTLGDMCGCDMEHNNPLAIKPAYVVLVALGGGCLLLVLTAIILLCTYPLQKANPYFVSGSTATNTTHTHTRQSYDVDGNDYVEETNVQVEISMSEMNEGEPEGKTYYNAEDVN